MMLTMSSPWLMKNSFCLTLGLNLVFKHTFDVTELLGG
jgi:hypothetical protein